MMRVLGNVLWHIPGLGFIPAILAFIIGFVLSITVIFAPVGLGLMELGKYYFAPFTRILVNRKDIEGESTGALEWLTTITTVLYFPIGVVLLVLSVLSMFLSCIMAVITIIAIILLVPYLLATANSLITILNPAGRKCVNYIVSEELERTKAKELLDEVGK